MFKYHKLNIYNLAKELVVDVYRVTKEFPTHERYSLTSQINRSAISIPSNIAEGSGRISLNEQLHFLTIAYSSLLELTCQLEISYEIGYISGSDLNDFMKKSKDLAVKISNYKNYLKK